MRLQSLIEKLEGGDDMGRLEAVEQLEDHVSEEYVLQALCAVALETTNFKLRERIIQALKAQAKQANRYFEEAAAESDDASVRRWALLNLSLMECRTARETVLIRLKDPDRTVQQAAALNTGLYTDFEFLMEIENYFERNRFALIKEMTCRQMAQFGRKIMKQSSKKTEADSGLPGGVLEVQ